jgi:F-type H+-transporting ATPase subunit epsilon
MLHLQIITPEKKVFDEEVHQITLPTESGEITILPHHVALVTKVIPGELQYKKEGKEEYLACGFGFAEISDTEVKLLVDLAVYETEIDEKEIEEAKKRAEEAIENRKNLTEEEYALAAANLQRSLAQLRIKRRKRRL